jgi:hypothetical protein
MPVLGGIEIAPGFWGGRLDLRVRGFEPPVAWLNWGEGVARVTWLPPRASSSTTEIKARQDRIENGAGSSRR